jgi:hypothetical protein
MATDTTVKNDETVDEDEDARHDFAEIAVFNGLICFAVIVYSAVTVGPTFVHVGLVILLASAVAFYKGIRATRNDAANGHFRGRMHMFAATMPTIGLGLIVLQLASDAKRS